MSRIRRGAVLLAALCALALTVGCVSKDSFQSMAQQPRFEPLEYAEGTPHYAFPREVQPDTVARGQLGDDTLLQTGKVNGAAATVFPFAITSDVLNRGQQRFDVFCAPCHAKLGTGNGMVVRAGFPPAATFHSDELRNAPVGHFFDVITNGRGAMPPYASQIAPRDRWAIIAYIRALQLSQNAGINDVPPDQRDKIGQPPR